MFRKLLVRREVPRRLAHGRAEVTSATVRCVSVALLYLVFDEDRGGMLVRVPMSLRSETIASANTANTCDF